MASRVVFSPAEDEQLIDMIAEHRLLWDMSDDSFKDTLKKELIWKEIAVLLNKSGNQCKKRWRNIRDYYKKTKQLEKNMPTGSSAPKKKASYWNSLTFLDTEQEEQETISNIKKTQDSSFVDDPEEEAVAPDNTEDIDTFEEVSPSNLLSLLMVKPTEAKRKLGKKRNASQAEMTNYLKSQAEERSNLNKLLGKTLLPEEEDDIDYFFKSIAATVKKFDAEAVAEVKSEIFSIVNKFELSHIRLRKLEVQHTLRDLQ